MNSSRAWKLLLLLCAADFVAYIAVFEVPPIMGDLVEHFGITYEQAGLFMTAYAVVRTIGSLLTGIYSDRYGVKQFILAGLVILTVAGFLSAVTTSYALMIVWRILIGIGATAIFIPGLATAMFLLPPQRVNLATGVFLSSLYLGLSVALLSTPILAADFGWQLPLKLYALLTMGVGVVFLWLTWRRDLSPPKVDGVARVEAVSRPVRRRYSLRNIPLMVVSGAYFLLLFQAYGMITWLPEYLRVDRSYSPAQVGTTSMLLGLVLIPGSIVAGWLGDRMGAWLVAVIGAVFCALCPAALIFFPNLTLAGVFVDVFFLALGTSMLTVPLTSILVHLVDEKDCGKAVGLVHTTGYAGSVVSTYLGGYLLTRLGAYDWVFGIFAGSMVLMLFLLASLKETYREAGVSNA